MAHIDFLCASLLAATFGGSMLLAQTPSPTSKAPPAPATLRAILLEQLRSTHNKADWFTPMNAAVAGLTPEQARWVPSNAAGQLDPNANHSVGMLAAHLAFWNERALMQLRGEKPPAFGGNNDETFNRFDAAAWTDIVQRLDRVMAGIEQAVERMPEDKLVRFAPMLANISAHNAYHTGQILYVRKLHGDWDPANGVK